MRVGLIGLGNMGTGMAGNLLAKGADLTVFARTPSKAEAFVARGATGAGSIAELAAAVDVVLLVLPSTAASREVLMGDGGVYAHARPGTIIIDHSTVDLATTKACAEAADAAGLTFLDAPISGGPAGAEAGTLAIMVGGDAAACERVLPVLQMMGTHVRHMGPTGAGTAMKLVVQVTVNVEIAAIAEGFALADRLGLDLNAASDVVNASFAGGRVTERLGPLLAAREYGPSPMPVRNMAKDLGIVHATAAQVGLDLPHAARAGEVMDALVAAGLGDHDVAATVLAVARDLPEPAPPPSEP
jgi:3-hydroxyisobutyrate dehydrogenase-like beta-hydroxyacid dehydrogenase